VVSFLTGYKRYLEQADKYFATLKDALCLRQVLTASTHHSLHPSAVFKIFSLHFPVQNPLSSRILPLAAPHSSQVDLPASSSGLASLGLAITVVGGVPVVSRIQSSSPLAHDVRQQLAVGTAFFMVGALECARSLWVFIIVQHLLNCTSSQRSLMRVSGERQPCARCRPARNRPLFA
jgi:hypothetical protein